MLLDLPAVLVWVNAPLRVGKAFTHLRKNLLALHRIELVEIELAAGQAGLEPTTLQNTLDFKSNSAVIIIGAAVVHCQINLAACSLDSCPAPNQ